MIPTPCSANTTCNAGCLIVQSSSATRSPSWPAAPRRFEPSSRPSAPHVTASTSNIFILADVTSEGLRLSEVLLDRLRAGVKVNMIYDAYGSRDTPAAFFDTLRRAGAKVTEFNPIYPFSLRVGWSPNDRDHRKITVVDGRIGFTGGVNLDTADENPPSAGDASRFGTRVRHFGAMPRFASRGRSSPNCRSCSSPPGTRKSRRHPPPPIIFPNWFG